MRRRSVKRARQEREYAHLRLAYLENRPACERCLHRATEIHHKRGRVGELLTATEFWVGLCHDCHVHITERPAWAMEQGWSLPRTGAA